MELKEYYLAVDKELDSNFEHCAESLVKAHDFHNALENDMPQYYRKNIAPEMAAEFIAYKVGLARVKKVN